MNAGLQHDALLYASDDAYVDTIVPFLRDGLRRGEGTVIATNERNRTLLAAALGADADAVLMVPDHEVYRSIHGAIRAYDDVLDRFRREGRTGVRAIGEIPYDTTADASTWLPYEPIAHSVFASAPLHVICPYDARNLPHTLIEHAQRTHPHVAHGTVRRTSEAFTQPEALLRQLGVAQAPQVPEVPELVVRSDLAELRTARQAIGEVLEHHLPPERSEEAILAISEALANGVRHGSGTATASVWTREGELVCVVRNDGPPIGDPFAGYRPPARPANDGMGLWITRQLADRLEIAHDARGPVVTLAFTNAP